MLIGLPYNHTFCRKFVFPTNFFISFQYTSLRWVMSGIVFFPKRSVTTEKVVQLFFDIFNACNVFIIIYRVYPIQGNNCVPTPLHSTHLYSISTCFKPDCPRVSLKFFLLIHNNRLYVSKNFCCLVFNTLNDISSPSLCLSYQLSHFRSLLDD